MAGRNLRERGSGQDNRDERPERSDPRLPPIAREGTRRATSDTQIHKKGGRPLRATSRNADHLVPSRAIRRGARVPPLGTAAGSDAILAHCGTGRTTRSRTHAPLRVITSEHT